MSVEIEKLILLSKFYETKNAFILTKSLGFSKFYETKNAFILTKSLGFSKFCEFARTVFVLTKSFTFSKSIFYGLEITSLEITKQLNTTRYLNYPANLPLEQTSQVWIKKTDGSVYNIEPIVVIINGERVLLCDVINPELLIGLTNDFNIVFAYKPKNILPNQNYKFVLKRAS